MAAYRRLQVLNAITESALIPIFYHADADTAVRVVEACLAGGARIVEFTNRGDGAHLVFEKLIAHFKNHPTLILGAGSLMEAHTAALYVQIGANFIVSPTLVTEIAQLCNTHKVAYFPGCGTPTEISQAEKLGVEICKYFPGFVGGPEFIKNVLGPMPWSSIMPTGIGEVTEEGIAAWVKAGVVAIGFGSNLIEKKHIAQADYAAITANVRQAFAWLSAARNAKS